MPESVEPVNPPRRSRLIEWSPVYYGWIILVVGAIGVVMTSPGQTYTISAFADSFIQDLGVSRSLLGTLYTVGTLTASLALPFVGRQIDRRGSRPLAVVVSLLLGLTCVYMGMLQNAAMLGVGFLLLRMLGQGCLQMVCRNVINQWWSRRRGMAMGITGVVSSFFGTGSFPSLINWLIPIYGWRKSYGLLGGLLFFVMLPISLVFFRNRPEDYGLQPDGVSTQDEGDLEPLVEENWTLNEAIRTRAFWLISAGLSVISALGTGITFHFFSIFADNGLSTTVIASIFLPIATTRAAVQLVGGFLIDRIPARYILSISLLMLSAVMLLIPHIRSVEAAIAIGLLMGIRTGLQGIVSSVVWAQFYGRRYLGTITGVTSTIGVAASGIGPMPLGIARDIFGSYEMVLAWFAILPITLAVANLLFSQQPTRAA